jgi:hypothetical protein
MVLTYHVLFVSAYVTRSYQSDEPIGFWFERDGFIKWETADPPELIRVGMWIAENEHTFRKSYRTTRRDCGLAIVFKVGEDAARMLRWLSTEERVIQNEARATVLMHRRRNKYQQLPGSGDREWSARMDKNTLKPLRIETWSPFSHHQDERGTLFVPVTNLRTFSLNW